MTGFLQDWRLIRGMPSAQELTNLYYRHWEKVARRNVLTTAATAVDEYCHPGYPVVDGLVLCSLRFLYPRGSVLLTFGVGADAELVPVRPYLMGGTGAVHASAALKAFHAALTRHIFFLKHARRVTRS